MISQPSAVAPHHLVPIMPTVLEAVFAEQQRETVMLQRLALDLPPLVLMTLWWPKDLLAELLPNLAMKLSTVQDPASIAPVTLSSLALILAELYMILVMLLKHAMEPTKPVQLTDSDLLHKFVTLPFPLVIGQFLAQATQPNVPIAIKQTMRSAKVMTSVSKTLIAPTRFALEFPLCVTLVSVTRPLENALAVTDLIPILIVETLSAVMELLSMVKNVTATAHVVKAAALPPAPKYAEALVEDVMWKRSALVSVMCALQTLF